MTEAVSSFDQIKTPWLRAILCDSSMYDEHAHETTKNKA